MAARDDRFDYEGEISSDSERGQALMRKTIADYTTETLAILHALDCFGITVEQVHEHHKKLAKQVLLQINAESYNFLCYAFTTACERFKPGRKIKPRILYTTPDGEGMVRQFNGAVCWGRWVELAKQTIAEGNKDVRIMDFNNEKYPTLLWHEKRNKEVGE